VLSFPIKTTNLGKTIVSYGLCMYCILCCVLLLYYKVRRDEAGALASSFNAEYLPLSLLLMLAFVLLFPQRKRTNILRSIKETVIAPFGRVGFRETLVGDFFTSLVKPNIGECRGVGGGGRGGWGGESLPLTNPKVFFHLILREVPVNTYPLIN
jgi:hypothetical protein